MGGLFFGAAVCIPAVKLSLWLDEILQLLLTRGQTGWTSLLDGVAGSAGGVPLGYVTQAAFLHMFGYSVFASRLPSLLAAVFACVGIGLLAVRSGIRRPLLAVLLFCLLALQVRYVAEARPYEQALCLTIWSTVVFLRLVAKPGIRNALLYALLGALALYTQPFAYFVLLSQLLWLAVIWIRKRRAQAAKTLWLAAASVVLAGAFFIPWFLYARNHWHTAIEASVASRIDARTLLVILHEITGGGYVGALFVAAFLFLGLRTPAHSGEDRLFWALGMAAPLVLTLAGDERFGYFFAIRQLIFILPSLVIPAVFGFEELLARSKVIALVLGAALIATLLAGDIRYFMKPREDWQRAAKAIELRMQVKQACYLAIPGDADALFEFFDSGLSLHRCPNPEQGGWRGFDRVVVARGAYATAKDWQTGEQSLLRNGFRRAPVLVDLEPGVELWRRKR